MSETKTTEKSNNQDLSLLEMDDEFEEFPANGENFKVMIESA